METSAMQDAFNENISNINKPANKKTAQDVDVYINEMKQFENDRVAMAKDSAKTAWKVAAAFGLIALMSVCAVIALTPLKTIENYMTIVDPKTGITQVLKPIKNGEGVSYGEVLDKYWIQRFMIERNSYEWQTIQNSYNTVDLMSGDKVFSAYSKAIRAKDSPLEVFGDKRSIVVDVKGVSFLPTNSSDEKLAQVHFTRQVVANDGSTAVGFDVTQWSATITFNYGSVISTEKERALNPLGFQVTSYREDRVSQ
ncbi:type IV secretion system protein [Shewanella sp. M16]|uniref:virB8 family protein n=1 Tax=Shewanella sp. M16 TaxID=2830837 RepID=UPI001BB080AB|nr:type IV secretion system protein [Shewanella sp. M16]MBS0044839.1 type IV secretion system protein [Shewanella sp. M16]